MRDSLSHPGRRATQAPPAVLLLHPAFMVIDKPAGLAVHPGPRTPRSLEDHLEALRHGYSDPPVPVHRLDRDTSGCLVLARRRSALRRLGELFAAGQVRKTYWAIVAGEPPADEGMVDVPLRKTSSAADGWRMIVDAQGQVARTGYRVLAREGWRTLLELTPQTGRTHQLRVHCAHIGCPIIGDPVYGKGDGDAQGEPMLLHARSIAIPWDDGADPVTVTAEPPAPFARAMPQIRPELPCDPATTG